MARSRGLVERRLRQGPELDRAHAPGSGGTAALALLGAHRAVAATAGADAAAPLFDPIAALRDYYGYLAADRLHRRYSLNARPSPG